MQLRAAVIMMYLVIVFAIIAHSHEVKREIGELDAKLDRIERKLDATLKHDGIDPTQFNAPPTTK